MYVYINTYTYRWNIKTCTSMYASEYAVRRSPKKKPHCRSENWRTHWHWNVRDSPLFYLLARKPAVFLTSSTKVSFRNFHKRFVKTNSFDVFARKILASKKQTFAPDISFRKISKTIRQKLNAQRSRWCPKEAAPFFIQQVGIDSGSRFEKRLGVRPAKLSN